MIKNTPVPQIKIGSINVKQIFLRFSSNSFKNDASILNSIQKDFLKTLPIQLELEEEGVKILLVHGSPRKNNEDISPNGLLFAVNGVIFKSN